MTYHYTLNQSLLGVTNGNQDYPVPILCKPPQTLTCPLLYTKLVVVRGNPITP